MSICFTAYVCALYDCFSCLFLSTSHRCAITHPFIRCSSFIYWCVLINVLVTHSYVECHGINGRHFLFRREMSSRLGRPIPDSQSSKGHSPNNPLLDTQRRIDSQSELPDWLLLDGPSQSHEVLRRSLSTTLQEQWFYLSSQLKRIKADVSTRLPGSDWLEGRLEDMLQTGADYRQTLMRDLHNLTSLSAEWRQRESEALSDLVQVRLHQSQVSLT